MFNTGMNHLKFFKFLKKKTGTYPPYSSKPYAWIMGHFSTTILSNGCTFTANTKENFALTFHHKKIHHQNNASRGDNLAIWRVKGDKKFSSQCCR